MKTSPNNIDLKGLDLPRRLCDLREARRLTQADLGAKAGLSYRTVHDLELGKRGRVQEKTLMLLAEALEVPLAELTGIPNGSSGSHDHGTHPADPAPPTPSLWKIRRPLWGILIVVLLLAAVVFPWRFAHAHAKWDIVGHKLVVRDGILGTRLWDTGGKYSVVRCNLSPWSNKVLLLQFSNDTAMGKVVMAVERSTGHTIWQATPDLDAVRAAFGGDVLDGGNLFSTSISNCDLNGDGEQEILVKFIHTENYPCLLGWFDKHGTLLGQYANHGHFNDIVLYDLDADGRDEVIASGTNNARVYAGATVVILDASHFRGAAVDSFAHPHTTEPDSCCLRVVVPNWAQPYMNGLRAKRLHAYHIKILTGENTEPQLTLEFGTDQYPVGILHLDAHLIPQAVVMRDQFMETLADRYPAPLITDTGPGDPAWCATWLAGYLRFGSELEH